MRLYHHPFSSNARRAVMTTIELGTPVDLVLVDLPKREQRQPAYLARNPAGRVPLLEDGSVIQVTNGGDHLEIAKMAVH